jgi:inosine/xanthosine triphosphate pyrophosphatase family protein
VFIYEHSKVITVESICSERILNISIRKGEINCAIALLFTNEYTRKIAGEWMGFIVTI